MASYPANVKTSIVQQLQDKIHQRGMQVYKYNNVPTFLSHKDQS